MFRFRKQGNFLVLASGGGLTLLLDNTRHLLTLCLGTGVGAESLLQETKTTLICKSDFSFFDDYLFSGENSNGTYGVYL